jgi:hypothetical protein
MFHAGGVLAYAPSATVFEDVATSRLNLTWIATHRFRSGQTYAMMFQRFNAAAYRSLCWQTPFKVLTCAAMSIVTVPAPTRAMWWLVRGIFHCGAMSYALGVPMYREYASR